MDLWFRNDVARILRAAWQAHIAGLAVMERAGIGTPEIEQYQQGYRDALIAVATGFGLECSKTHYLSDRSNTP